MCLNTLRRLEIKIILKGKGKQLYYYYFFYYYFREAINVFREKIIY